MPRRQQVPDELKRGPFTVADAERVGFSRFQLRSRNFRRLGRGAYEWVGLAADPVGHLLALHAQLPPGCVFSGLTAARLHGIVDDGSTIEVTVPHGVSVHTRAGMSVRSAALEPRDVGACGPLPVTTPLRTCVDLARTLPLVDAVAAVDAALYLGRVTLPAFQASVAGLPGFPGVAQARRVADLVEAGVESPMESRLRMVLVLSGLPRPRVQVELHDAAGRFLARPDLLYPTGRLAIEYDGDNHRERLVDDNRRQNRLQRAGYTLLRYTAADVYGRSSAIIEDVRGHLRRCA
jgi:very-short-patch-repair endonuclease